jgi:predicted PurR-regulated permease PerM
MNLFRADQFPFILLVILTFGAIVVLWSIMDMVLLGASLAIVLIPLHHRLSSHIRPIISAMLMTLAVLCAFCAFTIISLTIFSSNAGTLSEMFGTIGQWINNPVSNPMIYGVPVNKENLSGLLIQGTTLFLDYQKVLVASLPLIAFKMFVFFFTLFMLFLRGDDLKLKILSHVPATISRYVDRLSEVTVDTLYAIYIVQVAIAVLTFFIAIPVFYLLGYGNIIFYSFFAAFCELIPVLGSAVVFILVGSYAYALGDTQGVLLLFFGGYLIVSLVPEVYIRPVLVGRRVRIHPAIMFIGIVGGLITMGLAGFVLGPVLIVLLINTYRIYVKDRNEKGQITVGELSDPALQH